MVLILVQSGMSVHQGDNMLHVVCKCDRSKGLLSIFACNDLIFTGESVSEIEIIHLFARQLWWLKFLIVHFCDRLLSLFFEGFKIPESPCHNLNFRFSSFVIYSKHAWQLYHISWDWLLTLEDRAHKTGQSWFVPHIHWTLDVTWSELDHWTIVNDAGKISFTSSKLGLTGNKKPVVSWM